MIEEQIIYKGHSARSGLYINKKIIFIFSVYKCV